MKAALLPDRGVIKVTGDDARKLLHGLVTADVLGIAPGTARFCALLTPQGTSRLQVWLLSSSHRYSILSAAFVPRD